MNKKNIIVFLIIYLISAGGTFGLLAATQKDDNQVVPAKQTGDSTSASSDEDSPLTLLLEVDPGEPKDQACPINGKLYTKTEKDSWLQKRPMAVMIENAPDARPQSGLSKADIVYEAVAEGAVTRFLGIFYCDAQKYDVTLAPIRSARVYYINWAAGYNNPLYVHVGQAQDPGPADAKSLLEKIDWTLANDINLGFSFGHPYYKKDLFRTGKRVATEHAGITSTAKIWELAEEKRGWTNKDPDGNEWADEYKGWSFEQTEVSDYDVESISYEFWSGYKDYEVSWQYDPETNLYLRTMGGEEHKDLNNEERIAVADVIIMYTTVEGPIDEKKHMLYETTGSGDVLVFKNGTVQKGTWSKKNTQSELRLFDSNGSEMVLTPGQIWISVLSKSSKVTY